MSNNNNSLLRNVLHHQLKSNNNSNNFSQASNQSSSKNNKSQNSSTLRKKYSLMDKQQKTKLAVARGSVLISSSNQSSLLQQMKRSSMYSRKDSKSSMNSNLRFSRSPQNSKNPQEKTPNSISNDQGKPRNSIFSAVSTPYSELKEFQKSVYSKDPKSRPDITIVEENENRDDISSVNEENQNKDRKLSGFDSIAKSKLLQSTMDQNKTKGSNASKKNIKPIQDIIGIPERGILKKTTFRKVVKKIKVKKRVKRKISLCRKMYRWYSRLFFWQYSRIFQSKIQKHFNMRNLYRLPKSLRANICVNQFDYIQTETLYKLTTVIFTIIRANLVKAVILKVLEQWSLAAIPFLMTSYVSQLQRAESDLPTVLMILFGCTFLMFVSAFSREHSARYTSIIEAKTGQVLRGIFFSHIMTSNYSFLRNVDPGFIAKMVLFEFESITNFIGSVPSFVSFPFTFSVIVALIVWQVGFWSLWIMVGVFFFNLIILIFINHRMVKMSLRYKQIGSMRAKVLSEIMTDIRTVKVNSWEEYYIDKLQKIRKNEIKSLNTVSFYLALSNSIFFLIPLVCSFLIILARQYLYQEGEQIDVVVAFAIISMLKQLQGPLKILAGCLDLYKDFQIGSTSLSNFFTFVKQKEDQGLEQPWLDVGQVRMFNCTGTIEDDMKVHTLTENIFHGDKENKNMIKNSKKLFRVQTAKSKATNAQKGTDRSGKNKEKKEENQEIKIEQKQEKNLDDYKNSIGSRSLEMNDSDGDGLVKDIKYESLSPKKEKLSIKIGTAGLIAESHQNRIYRRGVKKSSISQGHGIRRRQNRKMTKRLSLLHQHKVIAMSQVFGEKDPKKRFNKGGDLMIHLDTSFEALPGEAICLMGRAKSGASGILLSIMEETYISQGKLEVLGTHAYLSEKDFFFQEGNTIRENIILHDKFVKSRYDRVLTACDLKLEGFSGGDRTEIIENGRNISSQEKRKINLARFLYKDRDIYLFDDYFDNVEYYEDPDHFARVVKTFLKGKTVVYISNKEENVKQSDYIYIMSSGSTVDSGTFDMLQESTKIFFKDLLIKQTQHRPYRTIKTLQSREDVLSRDKFLKKMSNTFEDQGLSRNSRKSLYKLLTLTKKDQNNSPNKDNETKKNGANSKFISQLFNSIADVYKKEQHGKITSEIEEKVTEPFGLLLRKYLFYIGKCRVLILVFLFLVSVGTIMGADIWLGLWSTQTIPTFGFNQYMVVYGGLTFITSILIFFRDILFFSMLRRNSNEMHMTMLLKFFNTSMIWFTQNPSSRFTYRITRDQLVIDNELNKRLQKSFDSFIMLIGGLIILNILYFGVMLPVTLVLMLWTYCLLRYFMVTFQNLSQLFSEKKSALQTIFLRSAQDSLNYRMLCMLREARHIFYKATDDYQRVATHLNNYSKRWLGMKLVKIKVMFIFISFLAPFLVIKITSGRYLLTEEWEMALVITWSIKLIDHYTTFIEEYTSCVSHLISVGRLFNYMSHNQLEWIDKKNKKTKLRSMNELKIPLDYDEYIRNPKETLPVFEAKNVSLSYGKKLGLDNISFKFFGGARVAIIGHSGSGKHSLMNLMLGLYKKSAGSLKFLGQEYENIRPIHIRDIGFHLSKNPILLGANVRECIDPNYRFRTIELIKILSFLGLYEMIQESMKSMNEFDEWSSIKNDPTKKLQLFINMSNKMAEEKRRLTFISSYTSQNSGQVSKNISKEINSPSNLNNNHMKVPRSKMRKISKDEDEKFVDKIYKGLISDLLVNQDDVAYPEKDPEINELIQQSKKHINIKSLAFNNDGNFLGVGDNQNGKFGQMAQKAGGNNRGGIGKRAQPSLIDIGRARSPGAKSPNDNHNGAMTILSQADQSEFEIVALSNFLKLKIHSQGRNIPWNMRKVALLAKAILKAPRIMFIDEKALKFTETSSWKQSFSNISDIFYDSTIFTQLQTLENLDSFEELVYMSKGSIKEHGKLIDLLSNKESIIYRKLKEENPKLLREFLIKFGIKDSFINTESRQEYEEEMFSQSCSSSNTSSRQGTKISSNRVLFSSKSDRFDHEAKIKQYDLNPKFLAPINEKIEESIKSRRDGRPNTRALNLGILNVHKGQSIGVPSKPKFGTVLNQPEPLYSSESEIWNGGTSTRRELNGFNNGLKN